MPGYENLLSDETVKLESGVGGWTAVDNCTVARLWGYGPFPTSLGATSYGNCLSVRAVASGDVQIATEKVACVPGLTYRASAWAAQGSTSRSYSMGLRFYAFDGSLVESAESGGFLGTSGQWVLTTYPAEAPANAAFVDICITIESPAADETHLIARPSILEGESFGSRFLAFVLDKIPSYLLDADKAIDGWPLARPLLGYLNAATSPAQDMADDISGWDYVRATDDPDGEEHLSTMADPWNIPDAALPWLAQLFGIELAVGAGVGQASWNSLEADVQEWEEWEENLVGSPGGDPDTIWAGIEGYNPDYYDYLTAWRRQISSGYNGIEAGQTGTIKTYLKMLMESADEDPYMYIRKHYRTNPWNLLLSVREADDPDPTGDTLLDEAAPLLPAGMRIWKEHGVERSALIYVDAAEFFENHSDIMEDPGDYVLGADTALRLIEDNMCSGQYVRLAKHTLATDPFMGGGVALARYFSGFALYSGAVEALTGSLHDITGDIEVRARVSDMTPPASGSRFICGVPGKWELNIRSDERVEFRWTDSGTAAHLAVSKEALNWSCEEIPLSIVVKLDVHVESMSVSFATSTAIPLPMIIVQKPPNGDRDATIRPGPIGQRVAVMAFGESDYHAIEFYIVPFDKEWEQLGDTVKGAGTTDIITSTDGLQILDKEVDPDVLGASCIVYRVRVYDGISGSGDTTIVDVDFTDESETELHTGVTGVDCFQCQGGDPEDPGYPDAINVSIDQAADGASGLDYSYWVGLRHTGDDFFYFGDAESPSVGDSLEISDLASADHDVWVYYADGTDASVNVGTGASISFTPNDVTVGALVAGKSIRRIDVYGAGTVIPTLASFDADDFFWDGGTAYPAKDNGGTYNPNQTTKADPVDENATWTLALLWDTTNEYEYSSHINRDYLRFKEDDSQFDLPVQTTFGYSSPFTIALSVRRFWAGSGVTTIVDNILSTGGWKFSYNGDNIDVTVTDALTSVTLSWDEVAADRIGKLNLIVLRRDPVERVIELFVNSGDTPVDSAVDTLVG